MRPKLGWFIFASLLAVGGCGDDGGSSGNRDGSVPPIDAAPGPDGPVANCTPASGTSVRAELVTDQLESPVLAISPPGDARLFVVEQAGRIRILRDGQLRADPFLDIVDDVEFSGGEAGLLGLAFHPDYPTDPRFWVYYTATSSPAGGGAQVVAEYRVSATDPNVADAESEERILEMSDPRSNHNGGMIAFGPDDLLYISTGDGGEQEDPDQNAQNRTLLLGKMLRIDVSTPGGYTIPPSNPHAGSPNGSGDPRPEIWFVGFRNPWRWSFDRMTNDMYIGDVGQVSVEEVSFVAAGSAGGANFGWNCREGNEPFEQVTCPGNPTVVEPIHAYAHAAGRCSVTGGFVYRGSCLPDLQGRYFFADYCTAEVQHLARLPGGGIDGPVPAFDLGENLSSFGQDATGELYVTMLDEGALYQIVAGP